MNGATYHLSWAVPTATRTYSTAGTRPLCAGVAALASFLQGFPLRGKLRNLSGDQLDAAINEFFIRCQVPPERALFWAKSVLQQELIHPDFVPTEVCGMTLDTYQRDVITGAQTGGVVFALACGLGKTLIATAAAEAVVRQGAAAKDHLLILCPLNAISAWGESIEHLKTIFTHVDIMSVDSAHRYTPRGSGGGVVIFDEAHMLGAGTTRRSRACHRIRCHFDTGFCLTGTFLHSGPSRVLSVLDLAIPGAALFPSDWACGETFHCLAKKNIGDRSVTSIERPTGRHAEAFKDFLSRHTILLTVDSPVVADVLKLPDLTLETVKLGNPWASLPSMVAEIVREALDRGEDIPHASSVAHTLARRGLALKLNWFFEALGTTTFPVVCYAEYTDSLDKIETAFKDRGLTYVRIDGSVSGGARSEALKQFQDGEVQIFLGQMDAACVSMNLQRAWISVAFDHTWKPSNYDQMLGRTRRRNQTRECFHYDLVANRLQATVLDRLRHGQAFNSELAEWQDLRGYIRYTGAQHLLHMKERDHEVPVSNHAPV